MCAGSNASGHASASPLRRADARSVKRKRSAPARVLSAYILHALYVLHVSCSPHWPWALAMRRVRFMILSGRNDNARRARSGPGRFPPCATCRAHRLRRRNNLDTPTCALDTRASCTRARCPSHANVLQSARPHAPGEPQNNELQTSDTTRGVLLAIAGSSGCLSQRFDGREAVRIGRASTPVRGTQTSRRRKDIPGTRVTNRAERDLPRASSSMWRA